MTSQQFIQWLRGFTEGVHEYNITPKQWDLLRERLSEVDDENRTQKVWGGATTGFIQPAHTTLTPPASFTITSGSYGAGTATYYPANTTVTYTTSGGPNWYSINKIENDSREK